MCPKERDKDYYSQKPDSGWCFFPLRPSLKHCPHSFSGRNWTGSGGETLKWSISSKGHNNCSKSRGPAHPRGPFTHSHETPCGQHDREVKRAVNWFGFFQFVTKCPLGSFLPFTLRNNKDAQPGLVPSSGELLPSTETAPNKKALVPSQMPPTSQNESATPTPGSNVRAPPRFSAAG